MANCRQCGNPVKWAKIWDSFSGWLHVEPQGHVATVTTPETKPRLAPYRLPNGHIVQISSETRVSTYQLSDGSTVLAERISR